MIFENLFAVYYRSRMAQKRFWKKTRVNIFVRGNEEFDATVLVAMIQVLFIMIVVEWIIKKFHLPGWILSISFPILFCLIYLNNKAFVKDREKRMAILDNYNSFSAFKKFVWIVFSIIIIIIPIYLFARVVNS